MQPLFDFTGAEGGLSYLPLGGDNRDNMTLESPLRFEGVYCTIFLERLARCLVLLRIKGTDTGELGDSPMRALNEWLAAFSPIEQFIDARAVRGASIDASSEWAS